MPSLLLEVGVEEMPARFVLPALQQLGERLMALLQEERIPAHDVRTWGTPRRLVAQARGLPAQQEAGVREVRGPAVRVAYDSEGRPTPAAVGFARAQGVAVEDLERRVTEAGEYVFARVRLPRRPAREVLAERLPGLIAGLSFPKTMRWADVDLRYGRPIRWITALLDGEVVPFELAGVQSGRATRGHRILSPGPHPIGHAEDYERVLAAAWVIADHTARRARILEAVEHLAGEVGGKAIAPEDLLEEVTFLVEFPTAFRGDFDPAFLELPQQILVTVMQHHQRYFALHRDGRLLPHFIAVRDGGTRGLDRVREGNEWVLRARLLDAQFFYTEDRKVPLEACVERLRGITFVEPLGSMYDKTQRIVRLAEWIADRVGLAPQERAHLGRAAFLCKADLATHVVRELPELQGTMGALYARLDGEPEPVAEAIAEHLQPRGADDRPPSSLLGSILGVADRADTLTGCLSLGLVPTGSMDPYGLRRTLAGLLEILFVHRHRMRLWMPDLLEQALNAYPEEVRTEEGRVRIAEFASDRIRAWLAEHGFAHDTIQAVLPSAQGLGPDFLDVLRRAEALTAFRSMPEFAAAYEAFDRAYRIWDKHTTTPPACDHPAEVALLRAVEEARQEVEASIGSGDYLRALRLLSRLRDPVATLFERVFVNDPNPHVRARRHALLAQVVFLFWEVAHLEHLAVSAEEVRAVARGAP